MQKLHACMFEPEGILLWLVRRMILQLAVEDLTTASKAEEEERRRAEDERLRQLAAVEAATKEAAEEAARQAAEQLRISEEAARHAQQVEQRRMEIEQAAAQKAQLGPSPEILARIQKELQSQTEALNSQLQQWLQNLPDVVKFSANRSDEDGRLHLTMCIITFILHAASIINLQR